jgi:CheY-like chemotaxis protein
VDDHAVESWEGLTLLLLNGHSDTIQLLSDWFGALGAIVHHSRTLDLCGNLDTGGTMLQTLRPDAILFDLAVPYERNWECFKRLQSIGLFGDIPIILTTVNRAALERLVGPTDSFEIIGTPHDLWQLQDLVEWRITGKHSPAPTTRN